MVDARGALAALTVCSIFAVAHSKLPSLRRVSRTKTGHRYRRKQRPSQRASNRRLKLSKKSMGYATMDFNSTFAAIRYIDDGDDYDDSYSKVKGGSSKSKKKKSSSKSKKGKKGQKDQPYPNYDDFFADLIDDDDDNDDAADVDTSPVDDSQSDPADGMDIGNMGFSDDFLRPIVTNRKEDKGKKGGTEGEVQTGNRVRKKSNDTKGAKGKKDGQARKGDSSTLTTTGRAGNRDQKRGYVSLSPRNSNLSPTNARKGMRSKSKKGSSSSSCKSGKGMSKSKGCVETVAPTVSNSPTLAPTTAFPSVFPSQFPSMSPSETPSKMPSQMPSQVPSLTPSQAPSQAPSTMPSESPSELPSLMPSEIPSLEPSETPSVVPSAMPSEVPSVFPSTFPSIEPSNSPTISQPPSNIPTISLMPSAQRSKKSKKSKKSSKNSKSKKSSKSDKSSKKNEAKNRSRGIDYYSQGLFQGVAAITYASNTPSAGPSILASDGIQPQLMIAPTPPSSSFGVVSTVSQSTPQSPPLDRSTTRSPVSNSVTSPVQTLTAVPTLQIVSTPQLSPTTSPLGHQVSTDSSPPAFLPAMASIPNTPSPTLTPSAVPQPPPVATQAPTHLPADMTASGTTPVPSRVAPAAVPATSRPTVVSVSTHRPSSNDEDSINIPILSPTPGTLRVQVPVFVLDFDANTRSASRRDLDQVSELVLLYLNQELESTFSLGNTLLDQVVGSRINQSSDYSVLEFLVELHFDVRSVAVPGIVDPLVDQLFRQPAVETLLILLQSSLDDANPYAETRRITHSFATLREYLERTSSSNNYTVWPLLYAAAAVLVLTGALLGLRLGCCNSSNGGPPKTTTTTTRLSPLETTSVCESSVRSWNIDRVGENTIEFLYADDTLFQEAFYRGSRSLNSI